jgi:dipeptidyl-peptidase 4
MTMVGLNRSAWRLAAAAGLLTILADPVWAQQKLLTLDDLYDPVRKVNFGAPGFGATYKWLNDQEYVKVASSRGAGGELGGDVPEKVNAVTGQRSPLFDRAALQRAVARTPGVNKADVEQAVRRRLAYNHDYTALLLTAGDDLYYWPLGAETLTRLTSGPGESQEAEFSPDGRFVAFVKGNNLHVADLDGHERALTTDGGKDILNGRLDWVYQEEVYGRGTFRAFWWSPDSSRLAFLRLDEHQVPVFPIVDHIPGSQVVEDTRYPRAGDPNPTVTLAIVGVAGSDVQWVDTSRYREAEHLIVDVIWAPDSRRVAYQVQDREQTWLDLDLGDAASGATRTLFREKTPAWVSRTGPPVWLRDGGFLWLSDRSGFRHIYRYAADGSLLKRVTDGTWEVAALYGVDEATGWIYFTGTERSPIGRDLYRVRLDGSALTRLSKPAGSSAASFNLSFTYYVGTWSDITTPPKVRLHRADGTEVRVIDPNEVEALKDYKLTKPEFVQVKTKDGFLLEAMLIKPPDFDPSRKYPVFEHTYSGPHAPQVRNAWGGTSSLYYQLLAERGIVVWVCDNRSGSGKGAESAWVAYKRLGETELADLEECLGYLKAKPWIDSSRIGLDGWSYGGFMTSYALTHSTSWSMGIAGGSVTDWRNYDSIYTERYMLLPRNNPDGYERTAPKNAAQQLHGQLFLIHGALDDNVHMANTIQFAYELEKAGKPFELLIYPKSRHGVVDPLLVKHMRERMLEFTLRTLKPESASAGTR